MTNRLFRLHGAVVHDPEIDTWLGRQPDDLGAIAGEWFERARECGDDVRELMHDGGAVLCVEDAPFVYVKVFRSHVNVGFFLGAALHDPESLLEGTGKSMRHVKLKLGRAAKAKALHSHIVAAYGDIKERLSAAPS